MMGGGGAAGDKVKLKTRVLRDSGARTVHAVAGCEGAPRTWLQSGCCGMSGRE